MYIFKNNKQSPFLLLHRYQTHIYIHIFSQANPLLHYFRLNIRLSKVGPKRSSRNCGPWSPILPIILKGKTSWGIFLLGQLALFLGDYVEVKVQEAKFSNNKFLIKQTSVLLLLFSYIISCFPGSSTLYLPTFIASKNIVSNAPTNRMFV